VRFRPPAQARSISREVNAEIVVVLGWGRAILLQLAHPLISAAIADRSTFSTNLRAYARRSMQTIGAMLQLTFGTDAEVRTTAEHINAIHRATNGTLREAAGVFAAGTSYSATDPALLTWVHATLLESLPLTYEQFVRPLTLDDRNRYCAEATVLSELLNFSGPHVPTTWAALQAYMDGMLASGEIHITDRARVTAAALLEPGGPGTAWLAPFTRRITLGLLPPDIRAQYGYSWTASDERRFQAAVRLVRRMRSLCPEVLCQWPAARRAERRARLQ
jgi:uncharacterized protein (DUF2236 family)